MGGYDETLQSQASNHKPKPSHKNSQPTPASPTQTGLSYDERKELNRLPKRIEKWEAQIQDIHKTLADPSFYDQDAKQQAQVQKQLTDLENKIKAGYQEWEDLLDRESES